MASGISQLPSEVQAILEADYIDLLVLFQLGPSFVVEGVRKDTSASELIEGTRLDSPAHVSRMRKGFEACATDTDNAVHAVATHVLGDYMYARYMKQGTSLFRHFVHARPYFGGQEGLDMLKNDLPAVAHRDTKELLEILRVGIRLCQELQKLHEKHVSHNFLNPHTVFLVEDKLVLHGRGTMVCTSLVRGMTVEGEEPRCCNLLPYLSPEASGRTSNKPDVRSDIYSVGCTLYEIIVRRPPLLASDVLSFIHRHMTAIPADIDKSSFGLPIELSAILRMCLEKSPDARYQSVIGLKYDLEELCRLLSGKRGSQPFSLASLDKLLRFDVSDKLCGRQSELLLLHQAWHAVENSGTSGVVLISGTTGIGKSHLTCTFLEESHITFLAGSRYQQYNDDGPFSVLLGTLQSLTRQIMTHDPKDIRQVRDMLLEKKGLIQAIADKVPEIKVLLNDFSTNAIPDTSPQTLENHMRDAFICILSVFTHSRPLILYQDDVQWALQAEIEMLSEIVLKVPNLLLVLMRRRSGHDGVLDSALKKLQASGSAVHEILLENLTEKHVRAVVTNTLHGQESPELQILTEFIFQKTQGNPSFVRQLLQSLHRQDKIYLQVETKRWRFSIGSFDGDELTPQIVDLIIAQIRTLPEEVQKALLTAAALGQSVFSTFSLSFALGQSLGDTEDQLAIALDNHVIKSLRNAPRGSPSSPNHESFSFLHDRVQEAAYMSVPADAQDKLHHDIAKKIGMYRSSGETVGYSDSLIANQFNRSTALLSGSEMEVALTYNLKAGKTGLKDGDPDTALYFMKIAEHLSKKIGSDLQTGFQVYLTMTEIHLAAHAYDRALELAETTLSFCSCKREATQCYLNRLKAFLALGQLNNAISSGLDALSNLNCPVPGTDHAAVAYAEKLAASLPQDPAAIMEMCNGPRLQDDFMLQVQGIINLIVLPVYMARPGLLPAVCYLSWSITSTKGISLDGAFPVMIMGAYLGSIGGRSNLLKSYACGKFALKMLDLSTKVESVAPALYHLFAGHMATFHSPIKEAMVYEDLAVSAGKAVFNTEYTVFSLVEKPTFLAWSGQNLDLTVREIDSTKDYVVSTKSDTCNCFLALHMHGFAKLIDQPSDAITIFPLLGADDPGLMILEDLSISHAYIWELWCLLDCIITRTEDNFRRCLRRCGIEYCSGVLGTHYAAMGFFLASFAILTMQCLKFEITSDELEIVNRGRKMTQEFAEFAPSTFSAKSKLLDALSHRVEASNDLLTLDMYEEAIEDATKYDCYLDQALAMESVARWLALISPRRSRHYLFKGYSAYRAWGCVRKVKLLEKEFPFLNSAKPSSLLASPLLHSLSLSSPVENVNSGRNDIIGSLDAFPGSPERIPSSTSRQSGVPGGGSSRHSHLVELDLVELAGSPSVGENNNNNLSELDVQTVLNASIQISQGMKAEEVFESLMQNVLFAAGADYGVLALFDSDRSQSGHLQIHTLADNDSIHLLSNTLAVERPDLVPMSVINSVLATRRPIIRNGHQDHIFDSSFRRDRYYQSRYRPVRSVLCMPILRTDSDSNSRGVLYLENNSTASAFTNQRLDCLTLLCTQSAMTLERAGVYHEMRAAKAQAEEATAQKSTFLANMSHEIRTPFNALLSCAIFLLDTSLTQLQKDYVLTIRDSATLTLSIIDGILDFSKVEQGMMDTVRESFSLSGNIETALQVVAQKASHAGIDLVFSRKHKADMVVGDNHHLRQVVLNLLGNAVKFTADGYVKITSYTNEALDESPHRILLVVEDTGIGISPKGIERLFKAFSQVDASINRSYGGTGLGLAISKKLVELMGGKIWVESVEGQGTKFFVDLPVELDPKPQREATMTIDETSAIKKQGRLALVVSRFHATADVLVDDLTCIGLITDKNTEILDAESIATAAKSKPYSLLFVDLQVDGALELVEALQKILPSAESHFQIVIITHYGLNVPQDMSSARIAGYIVKPVPKDKLRKIVSEVLNGIDKPDDKSSSQKTLTKDDRSSSEVANGSVAHPKPLRILLAEDNIINTKVALQHLKRLGYTGVVHAKDGIEVLQCCEEAADTQDMFDLILMDIQMPRLDGIGATIELFKRYPTRQSRPVIIALTANATSTDKERCLKAGMSGHLAKPILPEPLLHTLESVKRRPSVSAETSETRAQED